MKVIKKNIITIILAVLSILVIAFTVSYLNQKTYAKEDGIVTIEFQNEDTIIRKYIYFFKGDTLQNVILNHFNDVIFEESSYGPFLVSIEGYTMPKDYATYISIYIDGSFSPYGIGDIELKNEMTITLKVERGSWKVNYKFMILCLFHF